MTDRYPILCLRAGPSNPLCLIACQKYKNYSEVTFKELGYRATQQKQKLNHENLGVCPDRHHSIIQVLTLINQHN